MPVWRVSERPLEIQMCCRNEIAGRTIVTHRRRRSTSGILHRLARRRSTEMQAVRSRRFLPRYEQANEPKLITGDAVRAGLRHAAPRPPSCRSSIRAVGGQWMKEVCDLDRSAKNAWCFDCVPEKTACCPIRRESHRAAVNRSGLPSSARLLGENVFDRFGRRVPIASISSTRWAVEISACRFIRCRSTFATIFGCRTPG